MPDARVAELAKPFRAWRHPVQAPFWEGAAPDNNPYENNLVKVTSGTTYKTEYTKPGGKVIKRTPADTRLKVTTNGQGELSGEVLLEVRDMFGRLVGKNFTAKVTSGRTEIVTPVDTATLQPGTYIVSRVGGTFTFPDYPDTIEGTEEGIAAWERSPEYRISGLLSNLERRTPFAIFKVRLVVPNHSTGSEDVIEGPEDKHIRELFKNKIVVKSPTTPVAVKDGMHMYDIKVTYKVPRSRFKFHGMDGKVTVGFHDLAWLYRSQVMEREWDPTKANTFTFNLEHGTVGEDVVRFTGLLAEVSLGEADLITKEKWSNLISLAFPTQKRGGVHLGDVDSMLRGYKVTMLALKTKKVTKKSVKATATVRTKAGALKVGKVQFYTKPGGTWVKRGKPVRVKNGKASLVIKKAKKGLKIKAVYVRQRSGKKVYSSSVDYVTLS